MHFCVCLFFIVMCEYLRTTFLRRLGLTLCEQGVGREQWRTQGGGSGCSSTPISLLLNAASGLRNSVYTL